MSEGSKLISKFICNSVLDLEGVELSKEKWLEIQEIILKDKTYRIQQIHLKGTNITREDINPELLLKVIF